MATEIERKWLVLGDLPGHISAVAPELIEQGYVVIGADGSEVRLRRREGQPLLTVKSAGTRVRTETELALSEDQYAILWPATEGRRLIKRRHRVDGLEIDVYEGELSELTVVEREFASEADAEAFIAPAWFGPEVTEDRAYKNQQLALHGVPTR